MRTLAIVVLVALLAGCFCKAEQTRTLGDYEVEMLFEVDGARVYRFEDGGYHRYFVVQANGGSVEWQQSEGKTTRPVSISTALLRHTGGTP